MVHSTKSGRQNTLFTDVFQYHGNSAKDVNEASEYIIETITRCLSSRRPIQEAEFQLTLYYKQYNLRSRKDVDASLGELVWKHSELTGKYCGCQYWSFEAKSLFDAETDKLKSTLGKNATLQDAWDLSERHAKKTQPEDKRLVHEHVFPINHLVRELQLLGCRPTPEWVRRVVEKRAIGCVVLESEHRSLTKVDGDNCNPWLRYKDRIRLSDNSRWPPSHRALILDAGLLR